MQLLGRAPQPNLPMDVTVSGPPLPPCELDRLQVSQIPQLLDVAPKEELQSILQLLCSMFHTQNALISLFADRRIYLINCTGVFQEGDFPWRHSFCAWTMSCEHPTVMVVNDAQQDSRFCRNPYVTSKAVRSYLGAPLVSSTGHRLGTICFADAVPRVFDDNSVQIMCNFSELVTREIERDIMLARQKLQLDAGASKRAAAAVADMDKVQLRSLDCISSAVLLVDTVRPGWPVLHANSSWHRLLQQRQQASMTSQWVDAVSSSSRSSKARRCSNHDIVGQLLWPLLAEQLCDMNSSTPFGVQQQQQQQQPQRPCVEQLQQLAAERQCFTLAGLQLPGLGGQPVSLSFRSAEHGEVYGAVSICLPSFLPDAAELPAAASALAARSSDETPVTAEPVAPSLYFVTVTVQPSSSSQVQASPCSSSGASSSQAMHMSPGGQRGVSLVPCAFPQFARAADSAWAGSGAGCVLLTLVAPASTTTTSSSGAHSHDLMLASSTSSSGASHRLGSCSSVARAVCSKVEGLRIKNQIAAGSMGRVFRGEYFGTKVAVKVLDGDAVLRRDASSGLCLEALLGQTLQHPNIVRTMAWAVITGEERLPHAERLWGESLEPSKPSIALNHMRSSPAADSTAAAEAPALAAGSAGSAPVSTASAGANGCASYGSAGGTPIMAASAGADGCASHDSAEQCMLEGQTWMVLEYCDRGCLQDAVDRGFLLEGPAGPVSTLKLLATAAEIAAGMLHLHSQGIVHGDLSGFNVLLSSADPSAAVGQRGFVAKVADFGLSRTLTHGSKVVTKTYETITHMPPEMLEHGICSKAADVYSFGVLLFQMAASSRAWAGLSHQAVVQAVCVCSGCSWPSRQPRLRPL